jgi:hypothetical protein
MTPCNRQDERGVFNLLKDVEKHKGIPPYASELYG